MPTLHFDQIYSCAPNSSDTARFNFLRSCSPSLPSPLCKPLSLLHAAHVYVGVRSSREEWKKEVFSMALATEGGFLMDEAV